jgi:hypothetical protein
MTLSAWIRPSSSQAGWRTIVQREVDAYFLHASSDLAPSAGRDDGLVPGLVVAAGIGLCAVTVITRGRWLGRRRRRWPLGVLLIVAGCLADAWIAPTGSLVGPALAAVWFAATATRRAEAITGWIVATGFALVTIASVADLTSVADAMTPADGGVARTAALGALLAAAGLLRAFAAEGGGGANRARSGRTQPDFSPPSGSGARLSDSGRGS